MLTFRRTTLTRESVEAISSQMSAVWSVDALSETTISKS
jgi:hypothetical protein